MPSYHDDLPGEDRLRKTLLDAWGAPGPSPEQAMQTIIEMSKAHAETKRRLEALQKAHDSVWETLRETAKISHDNKRRLEVAVALLRKYNGIGYDEWPDVDAFLASLEDK